MKLYVIPEAVNNSVFLSFNNIYPTSTWKLEAKQVQFQKTNVLLNRNNQRDSVSFVQIVDPVIVQIGWDFMEGVNYVALKDNVTKCGRFQEGKRIKAKKESFLSDQKSLVSNSEVESAKTFQCCGTQDCQANTWNNEESTSNFLIAQTPSSHGKY